MRAGFEGGEGAGLAPAAASGSRARRAIWVSPSTVACRTASATLIWQAGRQGVAAVPDRDGAAARGRAGRG